MKPHGGVASGSIDGSSRYRFDLNHQFPLSFYFTPTLFSKRRLFSRDFHLKLDMKKSVRE